MCFLNSTCSDGIVTITFPMLNNYCDTHIHLGNFSYLADILQFWANKTRSQLNERGKSHNFLVSSHCDIKTTITTKLSKDSSPK